MFRLVCVYECVSGWGEFHSFPGILGGAHNPEKVTTVPDLTMAELIEKLSVSGLVPL